MSRITSKKTLTVFEYVQQMEKLQEGGQKRLDAALASAKQKIADDAATLIGKVPEAEQDTARHMLTEYVNRKEANQPAAEAAE